MEHFLLYRNSKLLNTGWSKLDVYHHIGTLKAVKDRETDRWLLKVMYFNSELRSISNLWKIILKISQIEILDFSVFVYKAVKKLIVLKFRDIPDLAISNTYILSSKNVLTDCEINDILEMSYLII